MENIRYGRLDATDEEVKAAARAVHADEVAEKLDKGYDSDVGEGGDRLSTGEKQLLSFARAVLADPAFGPHWFRGFALPVLFSLCRESIFY